MSYWERESRYSGEEHEDELLRKGRPSPGKRSLTHSTGSGFGEAAAPGKVPATLSVTDERSGAAPDAAVVSRVEATTGADLSAARVHTGAESQSDAAGLRARAFTVGSDIHFAAGQYQPGTPGGDHLLAHELVHTAQQGAGASAGPQLKSSEVSQEGDAAEVEADRIASAAMSGAAQRIQPVARAAAISRAPESVTGNPAERTDPTTGAATTSHRSIGVGDSANPPAVALSTTQIKQVNVQVAATELAPLHLDPPSCPLPDRVLKEDSAATAPAGFTQVQEIAGTVAAPQIHQEAAKTIYIANQPTMDDVQQAGIGDCYFMANLGGIVSRDPGKIKAMMAPDATGGATVTFWRAQKHSPSILERITGGAPKRDWIQVAVTVNDQLAVTISDNKVRGAQVRCAPNPKSQDYWAKINGTKAEVHRKDLFEVARWAPLMEKAYARFSEVHGQYGGADSRSNPGTSGYDIIHSGYVLESLYPFYGPQMDDPSARASYNSTAYTPGAPAGGVVAANAGIMEHLILLQGRGSAAAPGDKNAPIISAATSPDTIINRLAAAIPVAQADPDYANVDAARQGLVVGVATSIVTYTALPADPPLPAAQPKATAKTGIGTACVNAVRPGLDESQGEKDKLAGMQHWTRDPIKFNKGDATVQAADATRMKSMHSWLKVYQSPVVNIQLDGHSSSEGSDEVNMNVAQQRVDNVETEITKHGATPPHVIAKTAHGEVGATRDPAWRRVDVAITATSHKTNSLLDNARSRPIQEMSALMIDLRNMGTDNSVGQRGVYSSHAYTVVAVNIVTTTGVNVALNSVPAANRAALYPLVDPDVSTVTLRNPHHGNEPDRRDNNAPDRAGDGTPSGPNSDGVFTMKLRDFFMHFASVTSGVFPKT